MSSIGRVSRAPEYPIPNPSFSVTRRSSRTWNDSTTSSRPRELLVALDRLGQGGAHVTGDSRRHAGLDHDLVAATGETPVTEEPSIQQHDVHEAVDVARHREARLRGDQDVATRAVRNDDLVVALHQIDPDRWTARG